MKGKLVFGYGGATESIPCIYKDNGRYEGTIEELNIRKVAEVELLDELTWEDKIVGEKYGYRYGGGFAGLFEISEEEIQRLRRLNAERKAQREKREKEEKEKEVIEWANRIIKEIEYRRANGDKILSEEQERKWRKRYNDAVNEGGEGFIPYRATLEELARAEEILKGGC